MWPIDSKVTDAKEKRWTEKSGRFPSNVFVGFPISSVCPDHKLDKCKKTY
jgi:hypothetical protein